MSKINEQKFVSKLFRFILNKKIWHLELISEKLKHSECSVRNRKQLRIDSPGCSERDHLMKSGLPEKSNLIHELIKLKNPVAFPANSAGRCSGFVFSKFRLKCVFLYGLFLKLVGSSACCFYPVSSKCQNLKYL